MGQSLFIEIIPENFPNLEEKLYLEVHKANRTPYCVSPRYVILKLSEVKEKDFRGRQE